MLREKFDFTRILNLNVKVEAGFFKDPDPIKTPGFGYATLV